MILNKTIAAHADSDDAFVFADEADDTSSAASLPAWRVLIVDDEPDVHEATRLALNDLQFAGRGLQFTHAYTAAEAETLLMQTDADFAVLLLDVVMETPEAGLGLVRKLRKHPDLQALRIILRTGQPGYAPELETILDYDINDYKSKGELTRTRLYTSVIAALRSYAQLSELDSYRQGLEQIVAASARLLELHQQDAFATALIHELTQLLPDQAHDSLLWLVETDADFASSRLLAASPGYQSQRGRHPQELSGLNLQLPSKEQILSGQIITCLENRNTPQHESKQRQGQTQTLWFRFPLGPGHDVWLSLLPRQILQERSLRLLQVFASQLTSCFANLALHERLLNSAHYDPLLQIPNRNRFVQLIDEHCQDSEDLLLGLLDVDDFASLNATLDQHFGDRVLQALVKRLQQHLGAEVILGRVSSDCFGVLGTAAQLQLEHIQNIFAEPCQVDGETLRLSLTSGFVRLKDAKSSGLELLKDASIALKQAKVMARGKAQFFSPDLRTAANDRMRMLNNLRLAFSAERLFVVYQPQVELSTRRALGVEALLRWRTENGQIIPPDRFIPLAEQSGLIVAIGEWVARTACAELRRLIDAGYGDLRMAINVSHAQFKEPDFVERLMNIIQENAVPPQQIEIELTESVAAEDIDLVVTRLQALKTLGLSIAMDDFGTGYSSLSIISQLPIDRLKIDRSFITGMDDVAPQVSITEVILTLGKGMRLITIAEGVETEIQLQKLQALACAEGQGFLFARPMPVEELYPWLAQTSAS